jgi:hypothetical protein
MNIFFVKKNTSRPKYAIVLEAVMQDPLIELTKMVAINERVD